MSNLKALLSDSERAAIRAPIERARTLPRRAFISDEFYRHEVDHVLSRGWMAAAFSAQVPAGGDVLPLTLLDIPIFLVRAPDCSIRAFHNVCPYDSCEVVIGPQQGLAEITTPYHGWRYDFDGVLLQANYWDGTEAASSLDPASLNANLIAVDCAEWQGLVFVALQKGAPDFASYIAPVADYVRDVDMDNVHIGLNAEGEPRIDTLRINANWKTVYENYSPNVYHETFVHAMYRRSPHVPRVDEAGRKTFTEIDDPRGFLGLSYDNTIGSSFYPSTPLPPLLRRDGSVNGINTIANMFPNWVITIVNQNARLALFLPEGPGAGTQMVASYFHGEAASDPSLVDARDKAAGAGVIAREEDNRICESIQRARHSPAVDSQFYCPFWDSMHYTLSNLILDKLEAAEGN